MAMIWLMMVKHHLVSGLNLPLWKIWVRRHGKEDYPIYEMDKYLQGGAPQVLSWFIIPLTGSIYH